MEHQGQIAAVFDGQHGRRMDSEVEELRVSQTGRRRQLEMSVASQEEDGHGASFRTRKPGRQ